MDDCNLALEVRKKNRAIFNEIKLTTRMFSEVGYNYTFSLPEDILKGELRSLNFNANNELTS